ncbi:MAG: hypothetical protein JWO44_188 [Bacteroidetes bacterium]|nr:hypothetical protein [Bacteroidota bacterium]
MSKLHAEKLIKKDEPGVTIPKGSFRLRFMKEDVLFKKHFKAILLETPSVSVPIDSLNSAEGNFVVDKVEKGHIEGTFNRDSKLTPKANVTKTVGYEAIPAGKEIQPPLQSALLKDVKELQEANNGKLLIGVGSIGESVLRIQQALNQIFKDKPGYKPLKEDKNFGILTKNAVSEFQKAYGLKQGTNGVVGQETIQKLDEWVLMKSYKWIPSSVKQSATPATVTTYATAGLKNPAPAQKNPDLKKIKKSLDEMEKYKKQTSLERIGNTAFLSAAADLSDMDMGTFALEAQRLKMLKLILGFKYVDSEAEEVLIALIRSTPTQDIFKLVKSLSANNHELFKKLESKLQMGNYNEYHMVLRQLMFDAYGPVQTGFQMESLQMGSYFTIPWSDPGFIKSVTNVKIVYTVKQLNNGKISISWSTMDIMGSPTGNVTSIEADPFQMIGLKLKSNEEHLGEKDGAKGRVYVMPAINMLEMSNKQLNQAIGDFFDATMLVTGVGEIAYGTTLLRTLLGTADALFGAGNLVITSYRFDIAKTETGKTFLNLWDTTLQLYAIYGIGRLVVESPQIISRLSESWKKFKPETKNLTISSEEINGIDKTINSFDAALEQAALEGKSAKNSISETENWRHLDKKILKKEALKQQFMNSSDELMGIEKASDELIAAVSKKRRVIIAKKGSEELRMLEYFGAEASVGGEDMASIILRENPSKAAILEEFLHGTQHKLGIIDDLGRYRAEAHVKDFMIRHQTILGLSNKDVKILKRLMELGL